MTLPFHRLSSLSSASFFPWPYSSTRRDCVAIAEYTSASPTWSAVLSGKFSARMTSANICGTNDVEVTLGATALMVIFADNAEG